MFFVYIICIFIYAYWCPTRVIYQMMLVAFNCKTTGVTTVAFPSSL